jgi:threonine synthase
MPRDTPRANILECRELGAHVTLIDGLITDCGAEIARRKEKEGWFDVSTLKEPYRVEGKKTLGYELAEQLNWQLPDVILYPTGGGTGLIGMWKVFQELAAAGWVGGSLPRMFTVQSSGCAPVVKAFEAGADHCDPWPDPWTMASGLRVPGPLGDRLMLRALRESGGGAVMVADDDLAREAREGSRLEGIDFAPEGGAAIAAARVLRERGVLTAAQRIVLFNTGAGWLYRDPTELPPP